MRARSRLRLALRPVRGRVAPLTHARRSATRLVMRLCLAAPLRGHGINRHAILVWPLLLER